MKSMPSFSLCFLCVFASLRLDLYADFPIVFVSRNLVQNGNFYYPPSGLLPGMGPFSRFKVVGGRLLVRESSGSVRVLVDSTMSFNGIRVIDVSDPCVYWDASRLLFAGIEHPDSSWRIYEIGSDGNNFRKITFTNRIIDLSQFGSAAYKFLKYDDIDPCYLPDGRICFASTRYPSLSEFHGPRTTNLYIINSDLTNLHRITTERNGAEEPTIDPLTGKIVFSRWWLNIDRPSRLTANGLTRDSALALSNDIANVWQAGVIKPDGDALQLYAGLPDFRNGLFTYKPAILSSGVLLSVFVPHTPMYFTSGSTGIRWFNKGADNQHHLIGVNMSTMRLYVENPPSIGTMIPPYAADPVELPDRRILFSYAAQVENQDYGLYTINLNGSGLQLFYDIPGKLELNADVLLPKSVPPVIPDGVTEVSDELPPTIDPQTWYKNGGFRFDCVNIFTNGEVDQPMTDAPPITKSARIKFFLNFQRRDTSGTDTAIFLTQQPVLYNGAIHFDNAPADVSMFEQIIDTNNKVISGSKNQIAHVTGMNYGRFGTGTKCVGCHAGHTMIPVPINNFLGQYFNTSTSAFVTESSSFDTSLFAGRKVADRKARNDTMSVNWVASGSQNEYINLNWNVPIDIKKLVIYDISPNPPNNTNIQVTDCEVFLYLQNKEVYHIPSTGKISADGTSFEITGEPKIDEAKVIVKQFTGQIFGQNLAGLAEVETIAKISFYEIIGIRQNSSVAATFRLYQNYPNPFNPTTKIKFDIPGLNSSFPSLKRMMPIPPSKGARGVTVRLIIYDVLGRQISIILNQSLTPGSYEIEFNGSSLPSGIYFYRLEAGDFTESKKMVLLK